MRRVNAPTSALGGKYILVEGIEDGRGTDTSANAKARTKYGNDEADGNVNARCDVSEPVNLSDGDRKVLSGYELNVGK